jgi:hypothetical protein
MRKPADFPFVFPPGTKTLGINPEVLEAVDQAEPKPAKPGRFGRQKYRAVKAVYDGRTYDSKAEARRAEQLDAMKVAGAIKWWQPKPGSFHLGCPENVYRPDFLVVGLDLEGVWIEDVKGFQTPKFLKDVRLWRAYGPCPLHIINGKKTEIITPAGNR